MNIEYKRSLSMGTEWYTLQRRRSQQLHLQNRTYGERLQQRLLPRVYLQQPPALGLDIGCIRKLPHLGQIISHLGDIALFGQILDLQDLRDLVHISLMRSVRSSSYTHVCLGGIYMIQIFRTCLPGWDLYDLHDLYMFVECDLQDLRDLYYI